MPLTDEQRAATAGNLSSLFGAGITGYGIYDQADRVGDIGQAGTEALFNLGNELTGKTAFQPFGLTTTSGSQQYDPTTGQQTISLNDQLQGLVNQQQAGAGSLFGNALAPQDERIQSSYDAIRATQRPEERRQAMMLEGRLHGQGRSGIRSAQYGGSPEQLAQAKAVAEAKNSASLAAIGEARAQQAQDANIGSNMLRGSLLPEAQMGNLLGVNQQTANLNQTGQIAGANLYGQLGLGGIQTGINAEKIRADLIGGLFGAAGNAVSGEAGTSVIDSILKKLGF